MPGNSATVDLYIVSGCYAQPGLEHFAAALPELAWPAVQARVVARSPGYLELDLTPQQAAPLLRALTDAGASGLVVATAYRRPRLTIEEAQHIAERYIVERAQAWFPGYAFGPVQLRYEHAMWWSFSAICERLGSEGHIPGAVTAAVDKLDGHVWRPEAMEAALR